MAVPDLRGVVKRLRWLRETADMSARELDRLVGSGYGQTTRFERNGGTNVVITTVMAWRGVFGVDAEWLLSGFGRKPHALDVIGAVVKARKKRRV
jgi:hypothetical protein